MINATWIFRQCPGEHVLVQGYDYWALGHIHKPAVLQEQSPAIVYAGIPQGRDIGEAGPRGCYLVTVDRSADVHVRTEFIETASVVWQEATVSIDGIGTPDELRRTIETRVEEIHRDNPADAVICRITLTGRGGVHRDLVSEGALQDLSEYFCEQEAGMENAVYIERFIDKTALPIDREAVLMRLRQNSKHWIIRRWRGPSQNWKKDSGRLKRTLMNKTPLSG
ncbi:MAG: hypothetical protein U9N40_05145, partial [Euryarchaeota archaeon]|nr:hypothetical protein [Euryarchaeota archaeon]